MNINGNLLSFFLLPGRVQARFSPFFFLCSKGTFNYFYPAVFVSFVLEMILPQMAIKLIKKQIS